MVDVAGLTNEIDLRIRALPDRSTQPVRRVRREFRNKLNTGVKNPKR